MKITGSKAIIESLKKEKVDTIFGYPGGSIMPFYDELLNEKKVRHILARHEQGAAHMAEGYARASGKAGVCVSTSGPGGTNLVTGIADAYMDSVPIIAMSGQVPTQLIGNDAFQEADMFGITMPITKHNFKITDIRDLPSTMKMAFHLAQSGRPGPVHIDLPKDIQTGKLEYEYPKTVKLPGYKPKLVGHPVQIKKAVDMLTKAERPLILAGGGVIASNASRELVQLAKELMVPVTTTMMAKGAIDERHPLCIGMPGMHGKQAANWALQNCDVLFAIGCRFSDRITGNLESFAPEAKIIHVDIDTAEIGKNVPVALPIVGDAKNILTSILSELKKRKAKGKQGEWGKRMKTLREACDCDIDYGEMPIKPQKVMHELNKHLPKDAIVTTEVGQNQMWAMHFMKVGGPRQFISSGGLGTMGFGLPAAIGAKAAKPDKPVIDVAGDGSILMVSQEFTTSVEHDLPVIACTLNNNWLGMVKQWQKLFMEKRYASTCLGKMPDFVKLAEAYCAKGERVVKPDQIGDALKNALNSDVAYLIDIMVDPEEDVLPMVPPGGDIGKMIPGKGCPEVVKKMGQM